MSVSGSTMTSRTFFSVNSNAAVSAPVLSISTPSRVDWLTVVATSSSVKVLAASSFGSTPNRRSTPLAVALSATMIGRTARPMATSGGASSSVALSGIENEMFFGTISPNTTWRNETSTSVTMNATVPVTSSGSPVRWSGPSRRWWMAGSDTFRMSSEQTVMPSCVVASMSVACSIATSAVLALRLPRSASGSICERRAEMTANSAPTKNAFTRRSTTSQAMPAQSLMAPPLAHGRVGGGGRLRVRRVTDAVDAAALEALDAQRPALDRHLVAHLREAAELVHDEAGDGLVRPLLRHGDARALEQLVGAQDAGERDGVAAADHSGPRAVVLVGDLAHDLLDEVLEGRDAGGA